MAGVRRLRVFTCALTALGALLVFTAVAQADTVTLGPPLPVDPSDLVGSTGCGVAPDCAAFNFNNPVNSWIAAAQSDGTITSWNIQDFSGSAQLIVVEPVNVSTNTYQITAESPTETAPCVVQQGASICGPAQSGLNTYSANLPISAGEFVGVRFISPTNCQSDTPEDCTIGSAIAIGPEVAAPSADYDWLPTPAINTPAAVTGYGPDSAIAMNATEQVCTSSAAAVSARSLHWSGRSPLSTSTGPCDLNVNVSVANRFKSGLSRDGIADAAFYDPSDSSCMSGCTPVKVTVTDSKGAAVAGAKVDASVTGITGGVPPYPSGAPSPGFICDASKPTNCGSGGEITGLKTDAQGQVSLLYWAPGVTDKQQATITATASICTQTCPSATGTGNVSTTVAPHPIYKAHFTLSKDEAKALAEWSQSKTLTEVLKDQAIEFLLGAAIGKAADYMVAEEHAAEAIKDIAEAGLQAKSYFTSSNLEDQFMWLFLAGFKLSPTGLGQPPDQGVVGALPARQFRQAFIGAGNLLQLGDGLIWKLGIAEHTAEDEHRLAQQVVHLTAYEVSYCQQGGDCGPRYHGRKGIKPYLDLEVTSSSSSHVIFPYTQAVSRYNARAWMTTQFLGR